MSDLFPLWTTESVKVDGVTLLCLDPSNLSSLKKECQNRRPSGSSPVVVPPTPTPLWGEGPVSVNGKVRIVSSSLFRSGGSWEYSLLRVSPTQVGVVVQIWNSKILDIYVPENVRQ